MADNKKSKYVKSILLIISTLPFLLVYGIFSYFIPTIYVGFVVPYLIWRILFGKDKQKIQKYSLFWKLPIILFLVVAMSYLEIGLIFIFAEKLSLIWKIILFVLLLSILRCLTYGMMIFIWQPEILHSYKIVAYLLVIFYCIANLYFIYLIDNAPDTDDYSIQDYSIQKNITTFTMS